MWTPGCVYPRLQRADLPGQVSYLDSNKFVLVVVATAQPLLYAAGNHIVGNGPLW